MVRLTGRLDALARRLPADAPGSKDSINRAVFARHRRETDAVRAAALPLDYDGYTRAFEA